MSDNTDKVQDKSIPGQDLSHDAPLAISDVITEEGQDIFSEFLSVSISSNGQDTTLSATTVQGEPVLYSTTLHGITADDFQALINQIGLDTDLG